MANQEWNKKLRSAAETGDVKAFKLCIKKGADIYHETFLGMTMLMFAAGAGHLELCRFILDTGCKIDAAEIGKMTALMWAAMGGQLEVCRLLIDKRCKIDNKNNAGQSALHLAAIHGHLDVTRFLIEEGGFSAFDKAEKGKTPYDLAAANLKDRPRNTEVMDYLKSVMSKVAEDVNTKTSCKEAETSKTSEVPLASKTIIILPPSENISENASSNFERKLFQSFIDKNYEECKFLLENDVNADIYEVLSPVLIKAYETKDDIIQDLVFSRIEQESPHIVNIFCKQYADIVKNSKVWIGVECNCDQATQNQHVHVPCRKADLTFVIEKEDASDNNFPKLFLGFKTQCFDMRASGDNEAATVAKEAIKFKEKVPIKVPGTLAKTLFKQHSNLTMVCPSVIKSKGFLSGSAKLQETNCIQLICKIKGMIPIGECHFPLEFDGVPTDVLEGTSQLLSAVQIGDTISNHKGHTGTLGGFVKYYGIDTFLTCSHVVFGKNDLLKLQNKDFHFESNTISISNERQPIPVDCVLIRHALKYDMSEKPMEIDGETDNLFVLQENPEETSIDAALLLIQTPDNSNPKLPRNVLARKIIGAAVGTSSCIQLKGEDSEYLNKQIPDHINSTGQAFALAGYSGRQETNVILNIEAEVIIPTTCHISTRDNIIFYNQLLLSKTLKFRPGDSGTCIFGRYKTSGQRVCIGMLIGQSTNGQYIVTPMKDILNALGVTNRH